VNTRTILLWHNNGEKRITFTVNPQELTISRPNVNRVLPLALGGTVNAWGGRGLREVKLVTFLPSEDSPFFGGVSPDTALSELRRWQDSGDPVRLIISESDINDAFLIEDITEVLREGDKDVGLALTLREYKLKSALTAALASAAGEGSGAASSGVREDERVLPQSYTVRAGDTLWAIAARFYGDGALWRGLAEKNGVSDPKKLAVGRVLTL